VQNRGTTVNIGSFVGGGTLRDYGCGWEMRPADKAELQAMCRVLEECMQDGAFGIATALIYPPGSYAGKEELIELAHVVGRYGGVYITHVRSESARLLEGLQEAIDIGREGDCSVEIYHLKAFGTPNWKSMPAAIDLIQRSRESGIDISADMYPYIGSGTGLNTLLPSWAFEGNHLYERLRDPVIRRKIHEEMMGDKTRGASADQIMPVGLAAPANLQYLGMRISEIADLRGQSWPETVMDLIDSEQDRIFTIFFAMSEQNIRLQLKQPWMKISTDGAGHDPSKQTNLVHPRAYGTYTRVLGKYVRDEKVISLEEAVRKMTWAVASKLGIRNRGLVAPGMHADVVVFDPKTVRDNATFENPHRLSSGIQHVWVNGVQVLKDSQPTGALPGRIVTGPGRK
jgi:N-acyl-D-amino-acid deacylase